MPNIFDYLEWRGDIPFSADPFNDVDNLVLSKLSYTVFDGLVPEEGDKVPLGEVRDAFFRTHQRELLMKSESHRDRAPLLMDGMMSGGRFSGTLLSDYINIVDTDSGLQISAVTFTLSDGTIYIAYRGTDNTIVGWKEDFKMSYLPETGGQRIAVEYLNRVGAKEEKPIRTGGHSKGGNFAVYASAFADAGVKERIIGVYSNDGPGFRDEVLQSPEYGSIVSRVISIVPDTSIIGQLLTTDVSPKVVKSTERGFSQHDGLSWEVIRNDFVPAELTDIGMFLRETQEEWLDKIDDASRQEFVDTLFSLFESTGAWNFKAMNSSKLRSMEKIISSAQGLPREKQKQFMKILGGLIQSGGQNAMEWYNRMLDEYEPE